MRLYLWDYESYDEIPGHLKRHSLSLVIDERIGMIVECGYCKKEFVLSDDMQYCPHCQMNLVFPRADW